MNCAIIYLRGVYFMKKIFIYILSLLTLTGFAAFFAGAANGYDIKNVKITAQPQTDNGDVLITQEWTVEFSGSRSDGFSCSIPASKGAEYDFGEIKGISADIDSMTASLSSEASTDLDGGFADGTYTITDSDGRLNIKWNIQSFSVTHVFRLSYTLTQVIKNIDGKTVFYCTYIPADMTGLCQNAEITVMLPNDCSGQSVELLTANNYICTRSDNYITFTGGKTNGDASIGIAVNSSQFSSIKSYTTTPDGLTAGEIAAIAIACILGLTALLTVIFSNRIKIKLFDRRLRKNHYEELSDGELKYALDALSAAQILKTAGVQQYSETDLFIVTVFQLAERGVLIRHNGAIKPSGINAKLKKHEREAVRFFTSDGDCRTDEAFYRFINKFNRTVKGIGLFECISPEKRRLCADCFTVAGCAPSFDGIKPSTISEDVFKPGRITDADIVFFMFKEAQSAEHCADGLFAFREIYEDGFNAVLKGKRKK